MKNALIARVAHEINRAYCSSLGDNSQPEWDNAPDWQRSSALAGVEMHLANPDATPEQSHESWLKQKVDAGWVYGEVKDAEKKEHPCLRPYDELPPEQRSKDYLFRCVVHMLKDIPDETVQAHPQAVAGLPRAPAMNTPVQSGCIGVEYIGRRPLWKDAVYHSGLTFTSGQVRPLPQAIANKLLRHIDLFKQAEAAIAEEDDTEFQIDDGKKVEAAKKEREIEFAVIDQIDRMDKPGLLHFAKTQYNQDLDARRSVANLRAEAKSMIDRFGVV